MCPWPNQKVQIYKTRPQNVARLEKSSLCSLSDNVLWGSLRHGHPLLQLCLRRLKENSSPWEGGSAWILEVVLYVIWLLSSNSKGAQTPPPFLSLTWLIFSWLSDLPSHLHDNRTSNCPTCHTPTHPTKCVCVCVRVERASLQNSFHAFSPNMHQAN